LEDGAWSPLQFSLRSILLFMVPFAALFAILHHYGVESFFPTVALMIVTWFAVSAIRLVRRPGVDRSERRKTESEGNRRESQP